MLHYRGVHSLTKTCLCFFQSSWKWWRGNKWQKLLYHLSLYSYDLFCLQWASGHNLKIYICFQWKRLFYTTSLCSSDSLYFHRCFYTYHILFYAICAFLEMCVIFFVLTPVLLYTWNKRPLFTLHCVTCPFLLYFCVAQRNVT